MIRTTTIGPREPARDGPGPPELKTEVVEEEAVTDVTWGADCEAAVLWEVAVVAWMVVVVTVLAGDPTAKGVPASAETGTTPHIPADETATPEASSQAEPLQYSIAAPEGSPLEAMQTLAFPVAMPVTCTS